MMPITPDALSSETVSLTTARILLRSVKNEYGIYPSLNVDVNAHTAVSQEEEKLQAARKVCISENDLLHVRKCLYRSGTFSSHVPQSCGDWLLFPPDGNSFATHLPKAGDLEALLAAKLQEAKDAQQAHEELLRQQHVCSPHPSQVSTHQATRSPQFPGTPCCCMLFIIKP
eukprot:571756-Prorocentrum_minimum.AAC.5